MLYDNQNPFAGLKDTEGKCSCFWYNRLWAMAMSLYEWKGELFEGPNATLNQDFLEWTLHTQGQAAFIKDKQNKLRGLQTTRIGFDCYMQPVSLLCVNPILGDLEGINNVNAVWVKNNKFAIPTTNIIKYYAEKLGKLQVTLDVNLNNIRISKIMFADDEPTAQQLRKMAKDIAAGKEAVIVKKNIKNMIMGTNSNSIPVYSTSSEYLVDKLLQNVKEIIDEFMTCMGVDSSGANMIKHERNLVSEVNSNNQQIFIQGQYFLENRKKAAEIASEIFGTEITVDIRKESEVYELQQPVTSEEQPDVV